MSPRSLPALLVCATLLAQAPTQVARRLEDLLGRMTLEEKVDLIGGTEASEVRGVPRLGIPPFQLADGPMGIHHGGPATAYPGGIGLAATWDPALAERLGRELAREARGKGAHFLLAPGVNHTRTPLCGRNFEYFGEDPFLASRLTVGFIRGVQSQGVCATVKHFVANNAEGDRNDTDSRMEPRTLREIYLPVFEAAVKEARVGAVMTSYNKVDGTYMAENGPLVRDLLKGEWGFEGLVMSDWISTHDGVAAAKAGLDLEMPTGTHMNRATLLPALADGRLPVALLDDQVRRILRTALRFGWLDHPAPEPFPAYNPEGRRVALQTAREAIVLLKNDRNLLPLDGKRLRSVLVVGPMAHPGATGGGGSSEVEPFLRTSLLQGLADSPGTRAKVLWDPGLPTWDEQVAATAFRTEAGAPGLKAEFFANAKLEGSPMDVRTVPRVDILPDKGEGFPAGSLSERYTGGFQAAKAGRHTFSIRTGGDDHGSFRLGVDGKEVLDHWDQPAPTLASATVQLAEGSHSVVLEHRYRSKWRIFSPASETLQLTVHRQDDWVSDTARTLARQVDAVVVAVGFGPAAESEGSERTFGLPPGQEELILAMAEANPRTVVVVHAGGAYATEAWLDKVPALLQAWYPGQEGGKALAELLLGAVNPSGRLPVSFERRLEDGPAFPFLAAAPGTRQILYREGIFTGYRGFQSRGVKPLFPFGHGLSYTRFAYSGLKVGAPAKDGRVGVSFVVTNVGRRAGTEVAQVYVSEPGAAVPRPPRELKAFTRVDLRPGEARRVEVQLEAGAFATYDEASRAWRTGPGPFGIEVGASSEALPLRGSCVPR